MLSRNGGFNRTSITLALQDMCIFKLIGLTIERLFQVTLIIFLLDYEIFGEQKSSILH